MLLLSSEKFSINDIARIYQVHRDTVSNTFGRWKKYGIDGLDDAARSGRPPSLSEKEEDEAIDFLKKDPRSIKKALIATREKTGKEISQWTMKRIARKKTMRWKRMRKSTKGNRDAVAFQQAKEEIAALQASEGKGELDLHYFDETGFNLVPEVPYAWQEVGKTISIPSKMSKRINVLAFLSRTQEFDATTVIGRVNSAIVVAVFDEFSLTIKKKTVVIIDNASVHTSALFKQNIKKWEKRGLFLKYLPTYSPELNLIEILWRFIKYKWLDLAAYSSFKKLNEEIQKVLEGVGSKYQITFA
jgi:transposase